MSPFDAAPVVERWDGTSWQIMPTPTTSGSLFGISCPQPSVCFAAGTVHELWDGMSWSIQPLLADVSCPSRFFCMAVGDTSNGALTDTLAAKWTP